MFVFKQKTAYEMRIIDWSSDVCSSDLKFAGRLLLRWSSDVPALTRLEVIAAISALRASNGASGDSVSSEIARPLEIALRSGKGMSRVPSSKPVQSVSLP